MIKQLIDQFTSRSHIIQETRDEATLIEEQQADSLEFLVRKLSGSGMDTAYIEDLCRLLQLSNNDTLIGQYTLNDVKDLLATQTKLQPNNLDSYLENAYFHFNVLDQKAIARKIAVEGIKFAEAKLIELKTLLSEIEKENSQ